jgi:hypothetical protein
MGKNKLNPNITKVTRDVFHIEKTFNTSFIEKENNLCQTKVIVEGPKTSPPSRGDQPNGKHLFFDIWGFKNNVFEMTHAIGQTLSS